MGMMYEVKSSKKNKTDHRHDQRAEGDQCTLLIAIGQPRGDNLYKRGDKIGTDGVQITLGCRLGDSLDHSLF